MQQIQNSLEIEVNSDGIIAQYEGYFGLKEIDWTAMKENTAIFTAWIEF